MRKQLTGPMVDERVCREIEGCKADYEAAHRNEDELYEDVLKAIATDNCKSPRALAIAALKSKKIEFLRNCA